MKIYVRFFGKKSEILTNSDPIQATVAEWYKHCVLEAFEYNDENNLTHTKKCKDTFFELAAKHKELRELIESTEKFNFNILIKNLGAHQLKELRFNLTGLAAFLVPGIERTLYRDGLTQHSRNKEAPIEENETPTPSIAMQTGAEKFILPMFQNHNDTHLLTTLQTTDLDTNATLGLNTHTNIYNNA